MFDLHVHAAPDIVERFDDDVDTVARYAAAGFTGCVLKAHYESTVGRAAAAARTQGIAVYGGLALNQHVGGLNPSAVAAALASGARVIWFPTADSHTQASAGLPRLCGVRAGLSTHTYALPPVDPTTEARVREIVALIAEADAVLATGHISTDEVAWLLPVARAAGVRRMLLTHPSYTVPAMSAARAREFTELGACAEITTFQLLHQDSVDAAALAAFAREVGLDRVVLTSDAGQVDSPSAPDALRLLVERLVAEGLDRGAVEACAAELPYRLTVN
ncbi:hypothetical protein J4H86_14550 [Spiractinospora alimapuensis]|uniref:DUF6282 family protein n=1 Tax=Spiractinospora alimapuensis TaxID=2820884 RepID=UPI001F1E78F6|nr:DUF6282 family protein [Spiractinospora alimapuensis]QVQ50176.1 hypothetical protein J4H86_14550 [Spiractinospora alimapuensis]